MRRPREAGSYRARCRTTPEVVRRGRWCRRAGCAGVWSALSRPAHRRRSQRRGLAQAVVAEEFSGGVFGGALDAIATCLQSSKQGSPLCDPDRAATGEARRRES
jgi:hypothetical protein